MILEALKITQLVMGKILDPQLKEGIMIAGEKKKNGENVFCKT